MFFINNYEITASNELGTPNHARCSAKNDFPLS